MGLELNRANKVALVTGGGRGIGRATALAFSAAGWNVAICSRLRRGLADTADLLKEKRADYLAVAADVASPVRMKRFVSACIARWGKIDVLVNNAAVLGPMLPVAEYPPEKWKEALDINLFGLFLPTRLVLPHMLRRKSGCIINITSGIGRPGHGRALWGAYCVSKFGLEGFTEVLADELKGTGVKVYGFNPGGTRTRMRAQAYPGEDPRLLNPPERAAAALVKLAEDARFQSGASLELEQVIS